MKTSQIRSIMLPFNTQYVVQQKNARQELIQCLVERNRWCVRNAHVYSDQMMIKEQTLLTSGKSMIFALQDHGLQ